MVTDDINWNHRRIGKISCWITFLLGLLYVFITVLGFLSLNSHDEPIGDPYFKMMELLILMIAPFMAFNMIAIHYHASKHYKLLSHFAVLSMFMMAGITSSVHFVVLSISKQAVISEMKDWHLLFSFEWPSVVYLLDILAWDWFFALSFLFAAPIFNRNRLEKIIRNLMLISGALSLIGLLGVPFGDMGTRNIGIIGYAVLAPFVFLLVGLNFHQLQQYE